MRERRDKRDVSYMILHVADVKVLFTDMGYDRVFTPRDYLEEVTEILTRDIENKQPANQQWVVA